MAKSNPFVSSIIHNLAPQNHMLLARHEAMQAKIDTSHASRRGQAIDDEKRLYHEREMDPRRSQLKAARRI